MVMLSVYYQNDQLFPPQVIYVSRNPKDVVVSFYHFHKMAKFLPQSGSFPEFLNRFLESTCEFVLPNPHHGAAKKPKTDSDYNFFPLHIFASVHFGSWFDHIKGWTSQAASLNLLHVAYEQMSMVK